MSDQSLPVSRLYLICVVANLGGLLVGLHLAVFSGILEMPSFTISFQADDATTKSVITTVLVVGAMLGSLAAGPITDTFGRRPALISTAGLFAFSTLLTAVASSVPVVVVGRFIAGLGYALANVVCPMYTAELSPTALRGILVNIYQLLITVGILVAQISNAYFWKSGPWNAPLYIALFPALLMIVLVWLIVPESPVWSQAQLQNGDVETRSREENVSLMNLFKDAQARKRLLIGAGISASQQTTGINAVIFFGPALVADVLGMHGSNGPFLAACAVGLMNVLATIASLFIVERFGRRQLLLAAGAPMVSSLFILGMMRFSFIPVSNLLGVGALLTFIATFATTYGPLTFIVCAEIFPTKYKGAGMGVCSAILFVCALIVGATFLPLLNVLQGGIYLAYAGCVAASTVFVWKMVPETRNMSLREIDIMLGDK